MKKESTVFKEGKYITTFSVDSKSYHEFHEQMDKFEDLNKDWVLAIFDPINKKKYDK